MRKGFTLIELLAVIVILSIIALIATPLVLNVIDNVKKETFRNSVYGIINTAETYMAQNLLSTENVDSMIFYCDGKNCKLNDKILPLKGKVPNGTINININSESNLFFTDGEWCATKDANEIKVIVDTCDDFVFIYKIEDLIDLANEVDNGDDKSGKIYLLMNDLDFENEEDYRDYNPEIFDNEGWNPIGDLDDETEEFEAFSGTFNGLGHKISNLYIDRHDVGQGLFLSIIDGEVKNLVIEGIEIESDNIAGAIAGIVMNSTIKNCHVKGMITTEDYVGGLVGKSYETIFENVSFEGDMLGDEYIGGIVGLMDKTNVTNAYTKVNMIGYYSFGGLVGVATNGSIISNSYSESTVGDISIEDTSNVGGLIGVLDGGIWFSSSNEPSIVSNSHAKGIVIGEDNTGGLIGYIINSTVHDSYAEGTLIGKIEDTGGLIGGAEEGVIIYNSYAEVNVEGEDWVGGLIGYIYNNVNVYDCYSKSIVTGDNYVGGLMGSSEESTIENCYTDNIKVTGGTYVGGLIGYSEESTVSNCYIENTDVTGNAYVDDLIGYIEQ